MDYYKYISQYNGLSWTRIIEVAFFPDERLEYNLLYSYTFDSVFKKCFFFRISFYEDLNIFKRTFFWTSVQFFYFKAETQKY